MSLGFSHPVEMKIPPELKVTCSGPTLIVVKGIDKQKVNQFAAQIRSKHPVEPYNLKGIRYEDEVVKKKAGKTFVSGA
jgi:large subunit ribosomal protein L6